MHDPQLDLTSRGLPAFNTHTLAKRPNVKTTVVGTLCLE